MSLEMVFYTNPNSRGRVARWVLEEVGAPYRTEIVEYGPPMKSPDYLAIHPMGKVPALRHGDTIITENVAICAYLADVFPEAGLAPPLDSRGAYYRWLFFIAGPLDAAMTNRAMDFDPPADKQPMVGHGSHKLVMDVLEQAVPSEGYFLGARFSLVDILMGATIGWGIHFGIVEARPGFADYAARVTDRDAWRRATALDDAAMPPEQT